MQRRTRWLIGFVLLLIFAWFFRPWFHGFLMGFVISPLWMILLILFFFGIWMTARNIGPVKVTQVGDANYTVKPVRRVSGRVVGLYLGLIFLTFIGLLVEPEFRYLVTARAIEYTSRETLPNFTPIRLVPKPVAQRYADDTFQNPQEYLGDSQIALVDGELKRVFPRLPDGGILYFFNKLSGFVTVDVDTLARNVEIVDQPFQIAEGIGVFDNLYYQLPLKRYFVTYSSEPTYLKKTDGTWVTVVPYITYRGFPFTRPEWGGVMVVEADGRITDYSPEQAATVEYLRGNRLAPKELALFYSHAYAYRGGLLNKWFLHRNQTEVVGLPGEEPVFHVPTDEGFKQLIVAEPYGRSYGIYKMFLYDATTGRREIIEYGQNSQLTGPVAAADYIKKEFPTYDWTAFALAEPRPVTINNDLHWLLSVIPHDAAGIATTVLLNTRTNEVLQAKTQDELTTILAGSKPLDSASVPPSTLPSNEEIRRRIEIIEQQLGEVKELLK